MTDDLTKRAQRLAKAAAVFRAPTGHIAELVRQSQLTVEMLTATRDYVARLKAEAVAERDALLNECAKLAAAPAADVVGMVGKARLLLDTGWSEMGKAVQYCPMVTIEVLGLLDAALARMKEAKE